jgi:hypothetical protein
VDLRVADSQKLPFSDNTFDIVVFALEINFISDRSAALLAAENFATVAKDAPVDFLLRTFPTRGVRPCSSGNFHSNLAGQLRNVGVNKER